MTLEEMIREQQRQRAEADRAQREAAINMIVNSNPQKAVRVQEVQKKTGQRIEDETALEEIESRLKAKEEHEKNERARTRVMSTVPKVSFTLGGYGPTPTGISFLSGMALDRWIKDPENAEVTSVHDLEKMRDFEAGGLHLGLVDTLKMTFAYELTRKSRDFSMSNRATAISLLVGTSRLAGSTRSFLENMVETFVSPPELRGEGIKKLIDEGLSPEDAIAARTEEILAGEPSPFGSAFDTPDHQITGRADAEEQARREYLAAGQQPDYKGLLFASGLARPNDGTPMGEVEDQRIRDEAAAQRAEFQISWLNDKASKLADMYATVTGLERDVALSAVLGIKAQDETKDPTGEGGRDLAQAAIEEAEADVLTNSMYSPFLPYTENIFNPQSLINKGALQAPNTLGGMAAAAGGFAIGGPVGASLAGSAFFIPQAIGEEAETLRQVRDANGDMLPVQYRTFSANVTGTVVGLFEGELNAMGFKVLGLEDVIGHVVRKELTTALGSAGKTWLKTALGVAGRATGQSAIEGLEELEQTLVSAIGEEITKRIAIEKYGQEYDTRTTAADWKPVIEEAMEAAKEGFLASIAFGAGAGGSVIVERHAQVQRAENMYRELLTLVAQVKDMEIRTLSPERLEAFLTEALPADKRDVYIDIDEWTEIWSKIEGADPRSVWKTVFGDTKAFDEASRSKRQRAARVSTAHALRSVSDLGPTVMFDVISVMKRKAEDVSPKLAMQYAKELRDETSAEVKRLVAIRDAQEENDGEIEDGLDPEELAYYQKVRDQMIEAEQSLAQNAENPERARQQAEDEALFFLAYTKTNAKRLGLPLREVMGMTIAEAGGRPHDLKAEKLDPVDTQGATLRETGFVPAQWVADLVTTAKNEGDFVEGLRGQSAVIRIAKDGTARVVSGQAYLNYVFNRGAQVRVSIEYEGSEFDHRFQVAQRDRPIPSTVPTLQQGEEIGKPAIAAVRKIQAHMEDTGALDGLNHVNADERQPSNARDQDVVFASSALSAASSWGEFKGLITALSNAIKDTGVVIMHLPTVAPGQRPDGSRSGYTVTEEQMVNILHMFFETVDVIDRDAQGAMYSVRRPRRGHNAGDVSPWRQFYDLEVLRIEDEVSVVMMDDTSSYAAAEAAYYLLGGDAYGWEFYSVPVPGQPDRWFLKDKETNTVIDPYRYHTPVDYGTEDDVAWPGKKSGVRTKMSAAARRIISRVELLRENPQGAMELINHGLAQTVNVADDARRARRLVERFEDPVELRGPATPLNEPGWAIITAKRTGMTAEQEAAANKELRKELNRPGWHVMETFGTYQGDQENGFLVIGIDQEQTLQLQRKYGQEATLTSDGLMFSDGTIQQKKGIDFLPDTATTDYTLVNGVKFAFQFDWSENRRVIMTELVHMSNVSGLTKLDPAFQGTGMGGREFSDRQKNVGELFIPRMNFDIVGQKQEPRVAALKNRYVAQIPEGRIYDASTDFDGILKGIREQYPDEGNQEHFSRLEAAIRDSDKYDALRVSGGPRPGQVIVFGEIDVITADEAVLSKWVVSTSKDGARNVELAEQVQDIIDSAEPLKHPLRVYRGERGRAAAQTLSILAGKERGDVVDIPLPLSASLNAQKGNEFLGNGGVRILFKGVTKGVAAPKGLGESEIIVSSGTYRVVSIEKKKEFKGEHADGTSFIAKDVTLVVLEQAEDTIPIAQQAVGVVPEAEKLRRSNRRAMRNAILSSPKFWRWFGNSKAVDPVHGRPMIFFHGTKSRWDNPTRIGPGHGELGFHVSADPAVGMFFAAFGTENFDRDERPYLMRRIFDAAYDGAHDFGVDGSMSVVPKDADPWNRRDPNHRIYAGYVSVQKPLRLEDTGGWSDDTVLHQMYAKNILTEEEVEEYTLMDSEELHERLVEAGYHPSDMDQHWDMMYGRAFLAIVEHGFDSVVYTNRKEVMGGYNSEKERREVVDRGYISSGVREANPETLISNWVHSLSNNEELWMNRSGTSTISFLMRMSGDLDKARDYANMDPADLDIDAVIELLNYVDAWDLHSTTLQDEMSDDQFRAVYGGAETYILFQQTQFKSIDNNGNFSLDEGIMLEADVDLAANHQRAALAQKQENTKRFRSGLERRLVGEDGKKVKLADAIDAAIENAVKKANKITNAEKRKVGLSRIPSREEVIAAYAKHLIKHHTSEGWRKDELIAENPFKMTSKYADPKARGRGWELNFRRGAYQLNQAKPGESLPFRSKAWEKHVLKVATRGVAEVRGIFDRYNDAMQTPEEQRTPEQLRAIEQVEQLQWYNESRERLRKTFGGLADLFIDLLAATSPQQPVASNWKQALEALSIAMEGGFDDVIEDVNRWAFLHDKRKRAVLEYMATEVSGGRTKKSVMADPEYKRLLSEYEAVKDYGTAVEDKEGRIAESGEAPFKPPKKRNDKNFGLNNRLVALALADLFRITIAKNNDSGTSASSPKTKRFGTNLSGISEHATIDLWAARFLRRMMNDVYRNKFPRISPPAEPGVTGDVLGGQTYLMTGRVDISDDTEKEFGAGQDIFSKMSEMLAAIGDEQLKGITPQMLQAMVWFREKEVWSAMGWTPHDGGSVAEQMDEAALRRIMANLEAGGDLNPEDITTIQAAARAGGDVASVKVVPSISPYSHDGALDAEVVVGPDYDPSLFALELVRIANDRRLPTVHIHRIVDKPTKNSRPILEVWFNEPQAAKRAVSIAQRAARGSGLRVEIVNKRVGMDTVPGLRVMWLPELESNARAAVGESEARAAQMQKIAQTRMADTVSAIVNSFGPEQINSIVPSDAEVRVVHAMEYEDVLERGSVEDPGESLWAGTGVHESAARALKARGEVGDLQAEALFDDRNQTDWMTSVSLARAIRTNSSPGRGDRSRQVEPVDSETMGRIAPEPFARLGRRIGVHQSYQWRDNPGLMRDMRITGVEVPSPAHIAALMQVYSQDTVEVSRVFGVRNTSSGGQMIVDERAVTNRMPTYVTGELPEIIKNIQAEQDHVVAMGLEDTDEWIMMHNHPGGWANPSDGDLGNTFYASMFWNIRRFSAWMVRNMEPGDIRALKRVASTGTQRVYTTKTGKQISPQMIRALSAMTLGFKTLKVSSTGDVSIDLDVVYSNAAANRAQRNLVNVAAMKQIIEDMGGPDAEYGGYPLLGGHVVIDHRSASVIMVDPATQRPDPYNPIGTFEALGGAEQDPVVRKILEDTDHIDMTIQRPSRSDLANQIDARIDSGKAFDSEQFPPEWRNPAIAKHEEERELGFVEEDTSRDVLGQQVGGFTSTQGQPEGVKKGYNQMLADPGGIKRAMIKAMQWRRKQLRGGLIPLIGVNAGGLVTAVATIDPTGDAFMDQAQREELIQELIEFRQKTGAVSLYIGFEADADMDRWSQQIVDATDLATVGAIAGWFSFEREEVSRNPTVSGYDTGDALRARTTAAEDRAEGRRDIHRDGGRIFAAGARLYQAAEKDQKRGYYDPVTKKIKFLTAANPSTMIHEMGHAFLSMLMQVSSRPDVNAIAEEDRDVIMKFLGIEDWSDIGRDQQERFALAFERFVAEGNSPSVDMQEAFARANAWMLSVYGNIENVGVEINDEIREFFSRLLASKAQMDEARREYRIEVAQELSSLADRGEWEEYERVARKAGERGATDVRIEALKEARRETESWFRDTKERIRAEVQDEMMKEPVWAVLAFLQSGQVPLHIDLPKSFYNEDGTVKKLSREDLVSSYGKERLKGLPRPFIYSKKKDALDPNDVAVIFGFKSDDEMIAAIEKNGGLGFKREVTRRVDEIIAEKYGDMMRNRQQMIEKAADSIHNDEAFDMLLIESELLAKKLGKKPGASRRETLAAVQAEARRVVGEERIVDLKPHKYLQLEQRLSRQFRKLLNEGKIAEAHKVQEQRVWAHAMYRAAKDARQRVESTRRLIQRSTTTKGLLRIGKAGEHYVDAVVALSSLYSSAKITDKEVRKIEKLRAAIERIEKDEQDLVFGEEVIDKAGTKSYKEATVAEYDDLRKNLDNILKLARLKSRLKSRRRSMELEDVGALMLASAEANIKEGQLYDPDRHNQTTKDRIAENLKKYDADLVRVEPLIDLLDGGDINGPWREFFWDLFVQAQHQEALLLEQYAEVLEGVYKRLSKEQRHALYSKTVFVESTGKSWTRQALIVVALNMGTLSNYERLLNKQKNTPWNEGVIQDMVSHLTAEEWEFVQAVWDGINSLWPMIEDLEARLTGVRPKPIERREFEVTTSDGKKRKIRGGYYPLVYGGQSRASRLQDPGRPLSAHDYIRAQTPHPHTKERMKNVKAPILLDLDVMPGHIMSVIHDLTHREAIIQAQRILANEDVRFAIEDRLGEPYMKVFDEMVRRVARDNNTRMNFDGMMRKIRANATVATMGLKATVAIQNMANFANVMEPGVGVRPDFLARGMAEWSKNPVGTHAFIKANSPELAHRFNSFDRDVHQLTKTMTGRKTFRAYMTRAAFAGIAITDLLVAETSWMGKYRESLAKGNSHDTAVMEADRMITLTLGAGGTKDLSLIQANPNEMTKWFTMYYSWFAAAYSRFWSLYRGADNAWDEGGFWGLMRFMPYAFLRSFSFWIFPSMFAEWIANRGPEDGDDDDEEVGAGEWLTWGASKVTMYPLYTIPGLREIAGGLEGLIRDEPARPRSGLFADLMAKISMVMNKTKAAWDDDEEFVDILEELADSKSYTSALIDLVFGIGLGLPTSQSKITLGYWKDVIEGDREPENAWEFLRDSTFYSKEED